MQIQNAASFVFKLFLPLAPQFSTYLHPESQLFIALNAAFEANNDYFKIVILQSRSQIKKCFTTLHTAHCAQHYRVSKIATGKLKLRKNGKIDFIGQDASKSSKH